MNLKERGITVGDLCIILIIILTASIVVKRFSNDKKTSIYLSNQENISYGKTLLSNLYLNYFSV